MANGIKPIITYEKVTANVFLRRAAHRTELHAHVRQPTHATKNYGALENRNFVGLVVVVDWWKAISTIGGQVLSVRCQAALHGSAVQLQDSRRPVGTRQETLKQQT